METYMELLNKTISNHAETFRFHIRHHVSAYLARGFILSDIETDYQNAFRANRVNIEQLGVICNPAYASKVE